MTDTTDIAALREKYELALKDLTERLMECNRLNYCMDEITAFAAFSSTVIDQLEAERQRADDKKTAIRNIKNLSQQQMRDFCTRYSKDNNDGTSAFFDPNDVEWVEGVLSSDYFLSIFSTKDRALKYLLDEINIRKSDGLPYADYEYLINNQEESPIVFVINNGKPVLWDGFHRVAAAIYRGDTIYSIFAQAPVDNKGWEDAACAKHKENALLRDELAALKGQQVPVAYFAAAPDYGWDMFKNKEDAIATCQAEIDAYRDCRDDGWDDDVQRVCWGVVLQKAEGFDQQGVHTSNSHHTYQTCDYSLQPELFTAPQKPVPDEMREDILRCVDDSMHCCNSLSAPDYAVRVAGWLPFGGIASRWEASGFGARNICPQCNFIRNVTCTCKINLLGDDNDKAG